MISREVELRIDVTLSVFAAVALLVLGFKVPVAWSWLSALGGFAAGWTAGRNIFRLVDYRISERRQQ